MDAGLLGEARLTTASTSKSLTQLVEKYRETKRGKRLWAFKELAAKASAGWDTWRSRPVLFGCVSKAKPVSPMAGEFMSQTGITGIFIPSPASKCQCGIPDPRCISMIRAFAFGRSPRTSECSVWLAEIRFPNSDIPPIQRLRLRYNSREDAKTASSLLYQLDERVLADLRYRSEYWKKYEGELRDVGTKVNNTYLMAMKQTDGVKSYGMVVDLLIADYVSRNGNPDAEVEPVY